MTETVRIADLDIVFLSYDEPNAEQNWADLRNKVPRAKRVDRVRGINKAHKECARVSETEQFIVIDGDTTVEPDFFGLTVNMLAEWNCIHNWPSRNSVNGLMYGNGGIKCWTKTLINELQSHEIATQSTNALDFFWTANHLAMRGVYSRTNINHTPMQAWRAGFREGVKLCMRDGRIVTLDEFSALRPINKARLAIWCSVGADVKNGKWAMLGARQGAVKALTEEGWDPKEIIDFNRMSETFALVTKSSTDLAFNHAGQTLMARTDLQIADLDAGESLFFKTNAYVRDGWQQ